MTGRIEDTFWHTCPRCRGEGRIEHVTGYDPHDGSPTGWTEECDWCHGTGEVEDEMQEDIDGDALDEYLAGAPGPETQDA